MTDEREPLHRTPQTAADYLGSLDERPVFPGARMEDLAPAPGGQLRDGPSDRSTSSRRWRARSSRVSSRTPGPRCFGYVTGRALPTTVAADRLSTRWPPLVGDWLKELFDLPAHASFAIPTGRQMAHVTALAAARHEVLSARGFDGRDKGLHGSPPIRVVVGEFRHRDRPPSVSLARDRHRADRSRVGRRRGADRPRRTPKRSRGGHGAHEGVRAVE